MSGCEFVLCNLTIPLKDSRKAFWNFWFGNFLLQFLRLPVFAEIPEPTMFLNWRSRGVQEPLSDNRPSLFPRGGNDWENLRLLQSRRKRRRDLWGLIWWFPRLVVGIVDSSCFCVVLGWENIVFQDKNIVYKGKNIVYIRKNILYIRKNILYKGENIVYIRKNIVYIRKNIVYIRKNIVLHRKNIIYQSKN